MKISINLTSIALLISASICIISCKKEIKNTDSNPLQPEQKVTGNMISFKASVINYRSASERYHQQLVNTRKIVQQKINTLILERTQHLAKSQRATNINSGSKSVIHVPKNYGTLQDAIDNSVDGGKIIIDGKILQSGNVIVDVPNLTIQGGDVDDKSATINDNSIGGDSLIITVPGVTVKNLKLINFAITVNNANGETLMNLNATNNNPDVLSAIALFGSNNDIVKNCKITYTVLGVNNVTGIGIFLDDFSDNNEIDNCAVSNTQFAAFDMEGSNNRISNCEAFNFYRGFISFDGVSTGNVYNGCVANHSYNDAGFVFLNFNADNTAVTLKNCTANDNVAFASIVGYGGSVTMSNCTANSSTRNIYGDFGNYPAGVAIIGVGQTGEFANVSNCMANSNATSGILVIDMNFRVTNNTCNKNLGTLPESGILSFISDNGLPMSGIVEGNTTDFNTNNSIGIYLVDITNSSIIKNRSMNNAVCDFNETNCTGITLANNQFGKSCTGL